jgi:hypothetical protein
MANYKVLWSQPVNTLDELIVKLQAIQESNKSQGNTYVLNSDGDYFKRITLSELELSDGSIVRDVFLSTNFRFMTQPTTGDSNAIPLPRRR